MGLRARRYPAPHKVNRQKSIRKSSVYFFLIPSARGPSRPRWGTAEEFMKLSDVQDSLALITWGWVRNGTFESHRDVRQ